MSSKATVTLPGKYVRVNASLKESSWIKPPASCKNACNPKTFDLFRYECKEKLSIPISLLYSRSSKALS